LLAGGLDREAKDPLEQRYITNKEKTLTRILSEFGLKKEEVPTWIYSGELEYEANQPTHIHFCLNFNNAAGYAWMGGEPAYCIRRALLEWLALKELGDQDDMSLLSRVKREEIDLKAATANGPKQYVVVVRIQLDDPRLEQSTRELITRYEKLSDEGRYLYKDLLAQSTWEVRYFGDIAPTNIIGIVQVSSKEIYKIQIKETS